MLDFLEIYGIIVNVRQTERIFPQDIFFYYPQSLTPSTTEGKQRGGRYNRYITSMLLHQYYPTAAVYLLRERRDIVR